MLEKERENGYESKYDLATRRTNLDSLNAILNLNQIYFLASWIKSGLVCFFWNLLTVKHALYNRASEKRGL